MMRKLIVPLAGLLCACALTVIILACSGLAGGDAIAYTVARPDKYPPQSSSAARIALYIDPAVENYRQILTDVVKYSIRQEDKVLPYFDYIIIGGAVIKRDGTMAKLAFSEALKAILNEREALLKPLRQRGVKVLLGITGGNDGITFGSIVEESDQLYFVRQCMDTCNYYGLEGMELNDSNGESTVQSPYPELGKYFFSGKNIEGETLHLVSDESALAEFWKTGGGNMVNLMSRTLQLFNDTNTFQGDPDMERRWDFPILVRETNYGSKIPDNVPRYAFESSSSCVAYSINNGIGFSENSSLGWVSKKGYVPVIIDLAAITDEELEYFSERLGIANWGSYKDAKGSGEDVDGDGVGDEPDGKDDDGVIPEPGNSEYGLVYYTNLGTYSSRQLNDLCVTSVQMFGAEVTYDDL